MKMMKLLTAALFASSLIALPALADSPFAGKTGALTFAVDAAKTQCKFLSDAPMEKFPGTAEGVTGEIKVGDAANAGTTSGKITVPVASMKTGNDMRDKHLKGAEWLNASANPNITFSFDKVEISKVDGNRASGKAHGTFTVNGKGVAKVVPVDVVYAADKNALKVTAKFKVSLKDHAIAGKEGTVGSKVGEQIDIDLTLYANGK